MEFLKRYGYIFLYIAAACSFLAAAGVPEQRTMYVSIGVLQIGIATLLMSKSKKA